MFTHYVNRWRLFESFFEKGEFSCELNWSDSLTRELFLFVDAEDIEEILVRCIRISYNTGWRYKACAHHIRRYQDISLACQTSDSLLTLNRFSCSEKLKQLRSHIATGICHGDFPFCLDPHFGWWLTLKFWRLRFPWNCPSWSSLDFLPYLPPQKKNITLRGASRGSTGILGSRKRSNLIGSPTMQSSKYAMSGFTAYL